MVNRETGRKEVMLRLMNYYKLASLGVPSTCSPTLGRHRGPWSLYICTYQGAADILGSQTNKVYFTTMPLARMACLFLTSLSSGSSHEVAGCPQGHLSLSFSECPCHFDGPMSPGLQSRAWLSSSPCNQAQLDCINQELGCFQVLCIFSFPISKNCFSRFPWISKRRVRPDALILPSH